jgi:dienelactone hydrolase
LNTNYFLTLYRPARPALVVLIALLLSACGAGAPSTAFWVGHYTLPAGTEPVALALTTDHAEAVVTLAPGHAWTERVPLSTSGGGFEFRLPGRPAPLVFSGRINNKVVTGIVRQGTAHGVFRLTRTTRPARAFLGAYALDSGPVVGIADYGRLGAPLWAIDYSTGDFHALSGTEPSLGVGPTVLATKPRVGRIMESPRRLSWTGVGKGVRLAVSQYEVRFPSGDTTLAGTLSIPATPGKHPAVALVHGSGPALRDEDQFYTGLMLEHGIAVLSADKRGIGESGGTYPGERATSEAVDAYAHDAQALVRFLSHQPEVDRARLGLLGGSQAGWIIPLAAARSPLVRFAIIQSGPTVAVGESDEFEGLTGEGASPLGQPLRKIEAEVARDGPSGFDPKPWIAKLRIPVLWLYGGLDRNQPTALDVKVLEQLDATGHHDFSWHVYPHGNHGIFDVKTGLSSELETSPGMPARFFRDLTAWLESHRLAPGAKST